MSTSENYQWAREVRTGGKSLPTKGKATDIHQGGTVGIGEDGLRFSWHFWGLARSTWSLIEKNNPIEIDLGYVNGEYETVLVGTIKKRTKPEIDGSDTKYSIEGVDRSEGRVRSTRWTKTWIRPTINRMVRDIAGKADIGVGLIDAPSEPFPRRRSISRDKPLNRVLDDLADEAKTKDPQDRKYDWRAERGQLYFFPKEEATNQSVAVTFEDGEEGNVLAGGLEEADSSGKSDGPADLEFSVILDPRIEKDGLVRVNTGDHSGVYRVDKYEHSTSVRNGTHKTTGTLVDASSEFRATGSRNGGSGGS